MSSPATARLGRLPRLVLVTTVAALAVLGLAGCRDGGMARSSHARDGATTPTMAQRSGNGPAPSEAGTATGQGSGGHGSDGDLARVDQDLEAISSADEAIGSDLGAASSAAAQPDNG